MIRMHMRLKQPIDGQLVFRYVSQNAFGTAGGDTACGWIVIEHRVDDGGRTSLRVCNDVAVAVRVGVKEGCNDWSHIDVSLSNLM